MNNILREGRQGDDDGEDDEDVWQDDIFEGLNREQLGSMLRMVARDLVTQPRHFRFWVRLALLRNGLN